MKDQSPSNFSRYENSSHGIKINYPSNWKRVDDARGTWFRNANESVNIRVESIPLLNRSLEKLTIRQINLTKQQFPGLELVESNETIIGNNYTAHRLVFTFPQQPSDLQRTKEMQVWTLNGTRGYIISYFAIPDTYDNYLPIVHKIIDSFRITPIIKK
jgi:eukaryotic-like serine/threonine-protein kinase